MRLRSWLEPMVAAACLLVAGLAAAHAAAVPAWGSVTLRDVAVRFLRDQGDPVPGAMRYARTGAVYEVVLVGHFTLPTATRPAGSPAPAGTTLILDVDARSGVIAGLSLSDRPAPELAHGRIAVL